MENTGDVLEEFLVTIKMKDGKIYRGIRKGRSSYQMMKVIEEQIQGWNEYPQVSGFWVQRRA